MCKAETPTPSPPGTGTGPLIGPVPCPIPKAPPPPVVKRVIKISGKVPGTKSLRDATKQLPENVLASSTSANESLSANAPEILVRGCTEVELEATTTPANEGVNWQVKPNENTETAPSITSTDGGRKAKLKTDKTGSFSVIAELDGTKVVWNVVFVSVEVDIPGSTVTAGPAAGFKDGLPAISGGGASTGANTFVQSGQFVKGQQAFETTMKVKLVGGGTSRTLGIDKVKVHILQNGTSDTLTGHYSEIPAPATPPALTGKEVPIGSLPVVDAQGSDGGKKPEVPDPDPAVPAGSKMSPFAFTAAVFSVTPAANNTKDRTVWFGDSPAGAFPRRHGNQPAGKTWTLTSISGVNSFRTALAATSEKAPNAIVVHAEVSWTADYSGNVAPPPAATGKFTRTTAGTTAGTLGLISAATGGQDARDAGYEVFGPRFTDSRITIQWSP